jgi:hypothetical protein
VSRIGAGLQTIAPPLARLVWLIERHPDLVAELVDFAADGAKGAHAAHKIGVAK